MKQDAKLAVLQGNGVSPNKKAMEKAVKTKSEKKRRHSVILSGSLKAMKIQERGIVYLSHIPHGFYETQIMKFFSQFGTITNMKMGRSKRTGNPRGFAFIEFRHQEVAKIVAETMNNYLMFDKVLKCKVLTPEQVRPSMFKNRINPKRPPGVLSRILAKAAVNSKVTEEKSHMRIVKACKRAKKANKKFQELGINVPLLEILKTGPKPISTDKEKAVSTESLVEDVLTGSENGSKKTLKAKKNLKGESDVAPILSSKKSVPIPSKGEETMPKQSKKTLSGNNDQRILLPTSTSATPSGAQAAKSTKSKKLKEELAISKENASLTVPEPLVSKGTPVIKKPKITDLTGSSNHTPKVKGESTKKQLEKAKKTPELKMVKESDKGATPANESKKVHEEKIATQKSGISSVTKEKFSEKDLAELKHKLMEVSTQGGLLTQSNHKQSEKIKKRLSLPAGNLIKATEKIDHLQDKKRKIGDSELNGSFRAKMMKNVTSSSVETPTKSKEVKHKQVMKPVVEVLPQTKTNPKSPVAKTPKSAPETPNNRRKRVSKTPATTPGKSNNVTPLKTPGTNEKKNNSMVMVVDSEDDEIIMKTPPNTRKISSSNNSRVNSRIGSTINTPNREMGAGSELSLQRGIIEKLFQHKQNMTPKSDKKKKKKAQNESFG